MMKKAKETKEQEPTEEEKACKLCFSQECTIINEVCGHVVMCEPCANKLLGNNRLEGSKACPICRTIGRYFRYKKAIYS